MGTAPISQPDAADALQRHFLPLLAQIHRQWRRVIDRRLEPLGLTDATWLPLLRLARAGQPMRQIDLAAALSLDSSSVVRLIDGLEAAKLVERVEGADRRVKTIHLTPLGKSTVKRIEKVVAELRGRVLGGIPERQLAETFHTLERVAAAVAAEESASS